MARLLTAAQRRRYAQEGIVFPIRVLSAADAERYRLDCDALEAQLGGKPRTVDVRQMHLHFRWAYELATCPLMLDAVEDLLGSNLLVWATELFTKHPHDSAVSIGWHRDAPYMGLDPELAVTAWIALTTSNRPNGAMQVVIEPERKKSRESEGNKGRRHGHGEAGLTGVQMDQMIDVTLEPGEISLHDAHVLHGSGANRTSAKRVGFAVRFTTPEARPASEGAPAILARGNDRRGHFALWQPPDENDCERALAEMRGSARQHLDSMLLNLKQATH
ncbi:MAG: phytanoyl-CoA dioxygenase family protein [Planctomycetia bacterium]|nr:phytanoyl-CoA dioxygenase family protein [Planctomycetia bacterium]